MRRLWLLCEHRCLSLQLLNCFAGFRHLFSNSASVLARSTATSGQTWILVVRNSTLIALVIWITIIIRIILGHSRRFSWNNRSWLWNILHRRDWFDSLNGIIRCFQGIRLQINSHHHWCFTLNSSVFLFCFNSLELFREEKFLSS